MKKNAITLILLGLFLVSPLALAQEQVPTQEQAKIYSGFGRFVDNVKMFFSFRDKKVMLALDIRDKELSSAIMNAKNGDEENAEKNLERAKKRLQFVQNKVSKDVAENVKTNINKTIDKINEEKDLSNNFGTYLLEEKKTQLTAELAIEKDGKDGKSGKNKVEIIVDGENGQSKIMEIEGKIMEIDNQIKERVIDNAIKDGNDNGDGDLTPEVKTDKASTGEEKNVVAEEITVEDGAIDVVEDIVKDDKIKTNKENGDASSAVNNIDGKIDDEINGGSGEPGVVDKY